MANSEAGLVAAVAGQVVEAVGARPAERPAQVEVAKVEKAVEEVVVSAAVKAGAAWRGA